MFGEVFHSALRMDHPHSTLFLPQNREAGNPRLDDPSLDLFTLAQRPRSIRLRIADLASDCSGMSNCSQPATPKRNLSLSRVRHFSDEMWEWSGAKKDFRKPSSQLVLCKIAEWQWSWRLGCPDSWVWSQCICSRYKACFTCISRFWAVWPF